MAYVMRLIRKPTNAADTVAILAMLLAILAIVWARVQLYGTGDIEDALAGEASSAAFAAWSDHDEAVVRNRWIVGFSQ